MPTTDATKAKQQAAADANARIAADREFTFAVEDYNSQQAETQLNLNRLQLEQGQNEQAREEQRKEQLRQIASKYAARGIRGTAQAKEVGRFDASQTEARNRENLALDFAKAQKELRFGDVGQATPDVNIWTDPARFGTVGGAARRAALQRLQQQGINYTNVSA
jgi:hypothetical protein